MADWSWDYVIAALICYRLHFAYSMFYLTSVKTDFRFRWCLFLFSKTCGKWAWGSERGQRSAARHTVTSILTLLCAGLTLNRLNQGFLCGAQKQSRAIIRVKAVTPACGETDWATLREHTQTFYWEEWPLITLWCHSRAEEHAAIEPAVLFRSWWRFSPFSSLSLAPSLPEPLNSVQAGALGRWLVSSAASWWSNCALTVHFFFFSVRASFSSPASSFQMFRS